jgi:uncharacterized protein (DUF952 family)
MRLIYKLLDKPAWDAATAQGVFTGSPVDLADGFIHFSDAGQAQETANRYFKGQADLLLISFDADALGEGLRWEDSRGGALFPHLYGPLATHAARDVRAIALDAEGLPVLGSLEP